MGEHLVFQGGEEGSVVAWGRQSDGRVWQMQGTLGLPAPRAKALLAPEKSTGVTNKGSNTQPGCGERVKICGTTNPHSRKAII